MTTQTDKTLTSGSAPGLSGEHQQTIQQLRALCRLLDEAVGIPGTNIRVGLDSLAGLLPVVGDGATAIVSGYIIHRARKLGIRKRTLMKMLFNVALDLSAGAVPVLGDLFDVGWKCNTRNLRLLEKELQVQELSKPAKPSGQPDG